MGFAQNKEGLILRLRKIIIPRDGGYMQEMRAS
jgi:hypothetical protein